MPINFNILQGIPTPHQGPVANIPVQQNSLDQLATGINQGLQLGSNLKSAALERQNLQQNMQQNAALFPGRLHNQQTTNASNDIILQNQQIAQQSAKDKLIAFQKSKADGEQWMQKNQPEQYLDYKDKEAKTQESLADAALKTATSEKTETENYRGMAKDGLMLAQVAHQADVNAHNAIIDPKTGQPKLDPKTGQPIQPDLQAGARTYLAGLKMMGATKSALYPQEWNDQTYHALAGIGTQAHLDDQVDAENKARSEAKPTPLMLNTDYISDLKTQLTKDPSNTVIKAKIETAQELLGQKDKQISLLLSAPAQKAFMDNTKLASQVDDSLNVLKVTSGELNSIPQNAINPATGKFYGKFAAKGQALEANLNQLVLQAPSLLGLPGSALRIGSLWQIIQKTKPNDSQWMDAAKAITADLNYMGALKQESIWKQQAEQMSVLQKSNPTEADEWFKAHPEPLKSNPKPDLGALYKLFPEAQKMNLEKDWEDVTKFSSSSKSATTYSDDDLVHTAKIHNMTVDQVKSELAKRQK